MEKQMKEHFGDRLLALRCSDNSVMGKEAKYLRENDILRYIENGDRISVVLDREANKVFFIAENGSNAVRVYSLDVNLEFTEDERIIIEYIEKYLD
nr:MAG TPA: hypothetical protein [Caudoviricetes sp.]